MVRRWFGPRPVNELTVARHGSCGCCGCGGIDADDQLVKYAAYPNGLRLKLTIEDVPDGFSTALDGGGGVRVFETDASGMSAYNGTWYLDIIRSQYGCIFNALDSDTFDVNYVATDIDFYPLGVPYTQTVRIRPIVRRFSSLFLSGLSAQIEHYSPDYESDASPIVGWQVHPMIGLKFEPTNTAYSSGGGLITEPGLLIESWGCGWYPEQLPDVITGNLRFYLSEALVNQDPIDFTNPTWIGIDTFWDTTTDDFKIAGTFTAEIERL